MQGAEQPVLSGLFIRVYGVVSGGAAGKLGRSAFLNNKHYKCPNPAASWGNSGNFVTALIGVGVGVWYITR